MQLSAIQLWFVVITARHRRWTRRSEQHLVGAVKTVTDIQDVPALFNLDIRPPGHHGGGDSEDRDSGSRDSEDRGSVQDTATEITKALLSPFGTEGEVAGTVVSKMLSGLERRRRDKLQQQGIYSTHKSAHFTSPLGLPCNPQTSPLLCGNITDITDPTKPADELRRERRERKEDRERVRDINNKYKELTGDLPRNRGRRTGERATGERTTGDRTTGDRTTGDRTTGDRANRKRERAGQPGHINEVFDSTAKLDPFADDPFADDPFPDDPFPDDPFIDNMD